MRHRSAHLRSDQRGFALQVAILTTALIAIAVAVSVVIINRGGDVVDDLERQRITIQPSDINNEAQCEQVYGWDWDDSATPKCSRPTSTP